VEIPTPTPETLAFLQLQSEAVSRCVDAEGAVVDGLAALVTGDVAAAAASQLQRTAERCGALPALINPAAFPPALRARAEACREAFRRKAEAYAALQAATGAEGDFAAAQQGARGFLNRLGDVRPAMARCNAAA
jgi:hypothetical protein